MVATNRESENPVEEEDAAFYCTICLSAVSVHYIIFPPTLFEHFA